MAGRLMRGPDGGIYEVDEQELAETGLLPGWSEADPADLEAPEDETSLGEKIASPIAGAAHGISGGLLDEAGSAIDTGLSFMGERNIPNREEAIARYRQMLEQNRGELDQVEGDNPLGFKVASGAAGLIGLGKLGTVARKPLGMIGSNAAIGGASGYGHSGGDLDAAGLGTALGAAGGAAGYGLSKVAQKAIPMAEEKLASGLSKVAHGGLRKPLNSALGTLSTTAAGAASGAALGGPVGAMVGAAVSPMISKGLRNTVIPAVEHSADKMLGPVARHQAQRMLSKGNLGVISGDNPGAAPAVGSKNAGLVGDLNARNLDPDPMLGMYGGQSERSYMVNKPPLEDLVGLGQKYGQESVMTMNHGKNSLVNVTGQNAGDIQPMTGAQVLKRPPTDGSPHSVMNVHGKEVPFKADFDGAPIKAPQGVKGQLLQSYQRQLREKGTGTPAAIMQDAGMAIEWIAQNVKNPFYAKQAMQGVLDEPTFARKIAQGLAAGLGVPSIFDDEQQPTEEEEFGGY